MRPGAFAAALLLACAALACGAEETPAPGPVTTDAQALAALDLAAPGLEKVREAAEAHDLAAMKTAYLDYRRHASPARWRTMPSDKPAQAAAPDDAEGDDVLRHRIRNVDMGDGNGGFAWTRNPLPKSDPAYTDEWTYGDVGRMGYWKKLGAAYWKTLDEKYAAGWVAQLADFAAKNRADKKGEPALWRTLDAAFRISSSWPDSYFHFRDSPAFTPDAEWTYLRLVCDHARLLREILRNPTRTGNWVTSECLGLYTIGVLFPELSDAAEWRQAALDRLLVEVERMVPPDGFEAELTPSYHVVALNGFLGVVELARLNSLPVPDAFREKLLSMYRALVLAMDQAGNDVPTNDSWGIVNARALARQGLQQVGDDPLLEWAASNGEKGTAPPESGALPYAGFYAMRGGWKPDDLFLFFRAGPTGIGHEHEDMLEVVLQAWGRPLLFDAGAYPYDHSEWRRFSLATASHSTVVVDGLGQHRGNSKAPVAAPAPGPWTTLPLFDYAAGTYDGGYQKSEYLDREYMPVKWVGEADRSVSHTRRVLFLKPYYALVLDTLDGTGRHVFDAHFQIDALGADVDPATQAVASRAAGGVHLGLYPLEREHLAVDVVQGQKEPLLGWFAPQHRAIPTARFRKEQDAPARFATFLYPYAGPAPEFAAAPLETKGDGLWAREIHTAAESAEAVLTLDDAPRDIAFHSAWAGDVETRAALLLLRRPTGGEEARFGGRDVAAYRDAALAFAAAAPLSLEWRERGDRVLFFNGENASRSVTLSAPFAQEATLAPHAWTEVSASGSAPAAAPEPFPPVAALKSAPPSYAAYLQRHPAGGKAAADSIAVEAETMTLPPGAMIGDKPGAQGQCLAGWSAAGSVATARIETPAAGWYRLKLRYGAPADAVRSVLVDGQVPFAEAEGFTLLSTGGTWAETVLGTADGHGGWLFYLPRGSASLSLRCDGGSCDLERIELVPSSPADRAL